MEKQTHGEPTASAPIDATVLTPRAGNRSVVSLAPRRTRILVPTSRRTLDLVHSGFVIACVWRYLLQGLTSTLAITETAW